MIDSEYTITHRVIGEQTTVEHNISVIPHEDLFNIINRIRPAKTDEIVIKVIDRNDNDNREFPEEFWTDEERRLKILTPFAIDDGIF